MDIFVPMASCSNTIGVFLGGGTVTPFLLLMGLPLASVLASVIDTRPHIIFTLADDLGLYNEMVRTSEQAPNVATTRDPVES